jgi:sugar lactone lactonase YvrE
MLERTDSFTIQAKPGEMLSFATMFGQSNDCFYAPNLFVSGPGGAWIISPEARHLGTIKAPELPANFAWGDADGRTLYMAARSGLYRIRTAIPGIRPEPHQS